MQDFKQYLNPVYKQLSIIEDFSELNITDTLHQEEYPHLQRNVALIAEDIKNGLQQMDFLEEQIEHFIWVIDNETGDDKSDAIGEYNKLMKEMRDLIDRMNRSLDTLDNPYFGKIIFDRKAALNVPQKDMTIYIGKFAYFDKDTNKMMISDWRAPVSNLYYNYEGPTPNASYASPAGEIKGEIKQKRQLSISNGRINAVYEVKTGNAAADAFLLSQLNKRLGKKLTEIVSTIQTQQNEIIRDDVEKPILIQGVAGSGKTTIILHRLAYLFYTYKETIKPEKSLVIAPNKVFLDYVSDVLPSLGVSGINQDTYLFWARRLLGFTEKHVLENEASEDVMKFKGSVKFLKVIEHMLDDFEISLFAKMPTSAAYDIQNRYDELKTTHPDLSLKEQLDLAIEAVFAQRRFENPNFLGTSLGRNEAEEKRKREIKDYVNNNLDPYKIYIRFIREIPKRHDILETINGNISHKFLLKVTKESLTVFSKANSFKGYSDNDLAPLLKIHMRFFGTSQEKYDYIIVDEAQDLSPFQLITLSQFAKNNSITYAGDVAQAIVPPYHITDWDDLVPHLEEQVGQKVKTHILNRSYRSTHEIIEFANKTISKNFPSSYTLPEAVLRHGDEVNVHGYTGEFFTKSALDTLLKPSLTNEIEKETPTIALITKDSDDADKLYDIVKEWDLDSNIYTYKEENFHAGIQILPVKFAKGLEFDCVMVMALDNERYQKQDDARLLYVAMTRALHKLSVFTSEDNRSRLLP